jgi:esterase/lipase superfamily enzyme
MQHKLVSLTEKVVDIEIRDKVFSIARLTLKARDMVTKYREEAARLYAQTQQFIAEITESKDIKEIQKKTNEYKLIAEQGDQTISLLKYQVIEKILQDNATDFDLDFWESLDVEILDEFINAVMTKNEDVKKKEVTTQE